MSTAGKRDFRPKIHFSPETGWMNDPNGMFYRDGVFHLGYQKYPYGTYWGPMYWGHATSTDLIHWTHHPMTLYPDELGYIFSGSMVYDRQNSSNYGTNENPPIVAVYTSHGAEDGKEEQSIAYSVDGGYHFEKSYLNPVIPNPGISDFRDPKAFWNPIRRCWSLVLAAYDRVHFYASQDLKTWEKTGEFGPVDDGVPGVWECPDLFPLPYRDGQIWVLIVSQTRSAEGNDRCRTQYFLGDFDGETFSCTYPSREPLWVDAGFDNYAGVIFQNYEPVFVGWAMNWIYAEQTPTNEYCGQATLARRCRIEDTGEGPRLAFAPEGLESCQRNSYGISSGRTLRSQTFGLKIRGTGDGVLEFENSVGQILRVAVEENKIVVDRSVAGYREFSEHFMTEEYSVVREPRMTDGAWEMELIFDVSVLELYADKGLETITMLVYPDTPYDRVTWKGDLDVELYEINV